MCCKIHLEETRQEAGQLVVISLSLKIDCLSTYSTIKQTNYTIKQIMDTVKLQNLTKVALQAKVHNQKKADVLAQQRKTDAHNNEKTKVKQAVLTNLEKITRKDLEDTARAGYDRRIVYMNNKYLARSKMCRYMSTLVDKINEEMSLPAKLEQSTFRDHATHHFMKDDFVDVCSIRYTWEEKKKEWWHKFTK